MTLSPARLLLLLALLAGFSAPLGAQTPAPSAVVATPPQPTWQELNPTQQQILAPLADDWDRMENYRRKKWIGIAERYPRMGEPEQARVQRRMREWANMTPQQRKEAREKYKNIKQLPPERKQVVKQKWEEYANLPQEQRLHLQAEAAHPQFFPAQGIGKAFVTLPSQRLLTPLSLRPAPPATHRHPLPPALSRTPFHLGKGIPMLPRPLQALEVRINGSMPSLLPPMPPRPTSSAAKP